MTKIIDTLAEFCKASHLDARIIRAVVNQLGGWEEVARSYCDITEQN